MMCRESIEKIRFSRYESTITWHFCVTFLGWLSDRFQWASDLQLGDEKVTLNHLEVHLVSAGKPKKI